MTSLWEEVHAFQVVDMVDMEDIGEKKGFCRCWKSEKIGFKNGTKKARMNTKIQLGNATVIDAVDAKDIGEQKGFCRCWKSEKFPYCDGAHVKHNQETGDNVGPLVVKGKR
ncbi:zinc finger CDGSH type [Ancylostoma ceylanicum]|uniref:Zinc finger CDGSH type n=1 Tax=Ancylostoma ceylanicum TaxID=53326 RepID=A0A0D6LG24_9BILA|nr:zinc finger CDGSH type [Ancylostoma ceylanicum]